MKNFLASIIYLGILQKGGLATCNMKINLFYSGPSPLDYFRKRTILLHLNNTIIFTKQHKRREAIKLCNGLAYPTAMWKKLSFFALLEIVSKQYLATNTQMYFAFHSCPTAVKNLDLHLVLFKKREAFLLIFVNKRLKSS